MFNNELWQKPAGGGGGEFYSHQIANSCRFGTDPAASKLQRTPSSSGNRQTLTFSTWVKRSSIGTRQKLFIGGEGLSYGYYSDLTFEGTTVGVNKLYARLESGQIMFLTTQVFRDTSAWYHIVMAIDTTQATADNRCKVYINGERITAWDTDPANTLSQGYNTSYTWSGNGIKQTVGAEGLGNSSEFNALNGYMAETYLVDGTQLAIGDTGEFKNGVWIPKDPSGFTFGTNGFLLNYADAADLGNDVSGNNNDFTATSISPHDQMGDSPTFSATAGNGGNFMTYNGVYVGSNNTLAEGNLQSTGGSAGNTSGTFGMLTGKWYWECRAETVSAYGPTFGIGQSGRGGTDGQWDIITWQTSAGTMYGGGGYPDQMGTITVTSTGVTALSSGDIMSFWLDCDNRKLWIGKNGTIPNSGDPAAGTNPQASWTINPTGRYFTATCQNVSSGVGVLNAGQNPSFNGAITAGTNTDKNGFGLFNYDPSGTDFIACCAANIPTADAVDPAQTDDDYPKKLFSPILYTGNGSGDGVPKTNTITGLGFKPDYVNIKERTNASTNPLYDSSRGNTKLLTTVATQAEVDQAALPGLVSFDADGFKAQYPNTGDYYINRSNNTYVAWCQRANGGSLTTNNVGTQTSYVQTDPSGAFSITKYVGTGSAMTVGHGLSVTPTVTIIKDRDTVVSWPVYTKLIDGSMDYFFFDTDSASNTSGLTGPNSSVWTWQSASGLSNTASKNYIMYNFANVEGYCQVGTYYGNANDDGVYVYTGFKPSFMMNKPIVAGNWRIVDSARSPYNVTQSALSPNSTAAEDTYASVNIDFLSNGFKMRSYETPMNQATTFVYIAFAENPFQYSTAR